MIGVNNNSSGFYRHGFTIIELLIVIAIVGMLTAILIPAVMSARAAARRTQCSHRMSQVGKALNSFALTKGRYPGRVDRIWTYASVHDPEGVRDQGSHYGGLQAGSWVVKILPELGQSGLQDTIIDFQRPPRRRQFLGPDTQWEDVYTNLPILLCPSDSSSLRDSRNPQLSFVVNSGVHDPDTDFRPSDFVPDSPANGIFHVIGDGERVLSKAGQFMRVSVDYIGRHDGMATTMMLSENLDATTWIGGGVEVNTAFCWWIQEPVNVAGTILEGQGSVYGINEKSDQRPPSMDQTTGRLIPGYYDARFARPSSSHSGGVNVAFCDGHGQFLREDIPYWVYVQLMTPNGKKAMIDVYNKVPTPVEFKQSLSDSHYQ